MECKTVRIMPSHPSQGDFVEINESDFDATKHERYVPAPPKAAPVVAPPPVTPPPPVDPLANLSSAWRDMKPAEIRALAERVSGRTTENKAQAVEVIEAALAARK